MNKKTVKASEVLGDVRAGMNDAFLMEKYGLSEKGLESLFKKLINAGILKQSELDSRKSAPDTGPPGEWICPACGKPQTEFPHYCVENDSKTLKEKLSNLWTKAREGLSHSESLLKAGDFKGLWEGYKLYFIGIVAILGLLVISFQVTQRTKGTANKSTSGVASGIKEVPSEFQNALIEAYKLAPPSFATFVKDADGKDMGVFVRIRDVEVVKAKRGTPTPEIVRTENPQAIYCVILKATLEQAIKRDFGTSALYAWGVSQEMDKGKGVPPGSPGSFDQKWNEFLSKLNFDKSSTAFINAMITVAKSGKIRMNGLDADDYERMLQGSNKCPVKWDNVCPFGCHE